MNPGDLIDVQSFGRCVVVAVSGSRVRVQGADGFKFWVHRKLVQSAKWSKIDQRKTGPAGPATLPNQRFGSYLSRQACSYCGIDRLQYR